MIIHLILRNATEFLSSSRSISALLVVVLRRIVVVEVLYTVQFDLLPMLDLPMHNPNEEKINLLVLIDSIRSFLLNRINEFVEVFSPLVDKQYELWLTGLFDCFLLVFPCLDLFFGFVRIFFCEGSVLLSATGMILLKWKQVNDLEESSHSVLFFNFILNNKTKQQHMHMCMCFWEWVFF